MKMNNPVITTDFLTPPCNFKVGVICEDEIIDGEKFTVRKEVKGFRKIHDAIGYAQKLTRIYKKVEIKSKIKASCWETISFEEGE
jgi:hypothetical protein